MTGTLQFRTTREAHASALTSIQQFALNDVAATMGVVVTVFEEHVTRGRQTMATHLRHFRILDRSRVRYPEDMVAFNTDDFAGRDS